MNMGSWYLWYVLTWALGNPLLALVVVIAGGWALEHYTVGFLPSPLRLYRRWARRAELRRRILASPHDRRARFELADLLLDAGKPAAALPLIRANAEAGDEDAQTLFLLGKACLRSGHLDQGVKVMRAALEEEPKVRQGEGWLELGRALLAHGAFDEACEALGEFLRLRTGTIQGRVLLARALEGCGDASAARAMREQAWREYVSSPRYLQRQERRWAWRLKPSRPAIYGALVLVGGGLVGWGYARIPPREHPYAALAHRIQQEAREGAKHLDPKLRAAIAEHERVLEAGRTAPGAAELRAAGCHQVYVGSLAAYAEARHKWEIAMGAKPGRVLPRPAQPTLITCVRAPLSCEQVAAIYLRAVGRPSTAFTAAVYANGTLGCQVDFAPDGKRL